jgi:hypothetical protein
VFSSGRRAVGCGSGRRLAVDDDLGHGDLVGLLDDLLRGLVVDGVEHYLRHREHHAQPVGDLQKKTHMIDQTYARQTVWPGLSQKKKCGLVVYVGVGSDQRQSPADGWF